MLTKHAAFRKDTAYQPTNVQMQHRHMAFIASVIATMPGHAPSLRAQRQSTAAAFADALAGSNPRFDRERFMLACKLESTL